MEQELYDFHKNQQFKHWWFVGRNKIIETFINKSNTVDKKEILDIGSGFGVCIPTLLRYGKVDALEPFKGSHETLKSLGASTIYQCENFPTEYPDKAYDMVTMFDVLEHIENDVFVLKTIKERLLKKGGKMYITVPAYMWLWTNHDVKNKHFRRYNKSTLTKALKAAGFFDFRVTYFMTLLFPLAIAERLVQKVFPSKAMDDNKVSLFNGLLKNIFFKESLFINNLQFPFGLSLIVEVKNN